MFQALFALFIGWLLGLIGLDTLLDNMLGWNQQGYYISWFTFGSIVFLSRLFKK